MPPLLSYVEGANDNLTTLLKFRRGAFEAELPVRPTFLTYSKCGNITPTYDVMQFLVLFVFLASSLTIYHARLNILPPFIPNEYMYTHCAGKEGDERWNAFAYATRDMMCKMTGWTKVD